jgi:outer membrane protein assembly factor BamD
LEATLKPSYFLTTLILILPLCTASCSKPVLKETSPEEKLVEARMDVEKGRWEKANENLEELRYATAGTRIGGEVQFLLGETAFRRGKYPEAESYFAAYLTTYKDGPFSERAIYLQAESKIKQIQKRKLGFFSIKSYIPHDRDVSLLREARVLFEIYMEKYPGGEWFDIASERAEDLLIKEGKHELDIAAFYLKRKSPRSALARANRLLDSDYPESIKTEARELARKAEQALLSAGES